MYLLKPRSRGQPACRRLLSTLIAAVLSIGAATVSLADDENSAEARIYKALGEKTKIDFRENPLQEIADYLSDLHKIEIQLDKLVLEEAGLGADTLITRHLHNLSLRATLRLMLRDLDLTFVVDEEVLLITTPDEASSRLTTKLYPVADLVDKTPETPYSSDDADFDPLIDVIKRFAAPADWSEQLGGLSGFAKSGVLVVAETPDRQEQVGLMLAALRRLRAARNDLKTRRGPKAEHDKEEIVRVYRVSNVKGLMPVVKDTVAKGNAEVVHWFPPDYSAAKRSAKELSDLIKKAVAPKSWTEQHVIRTFPGTLVIRQSRQVHREIHRLLKGMDLLGGAITLSPVTDAMPDRSGLPTSIYLRENAAEARIRKALGEKTEIELLETSLFDFVKLVEEKHKIEIELDGIYLEEAGVGGDILLTKSLKDVSLRSALRLVLRDLDLTFVIRDEVLLITTPDEANSMLVTKFYPVMDLITGGDDPLGGGELDFDPLIELIEATVAPEFWGESGGPEPIGFLEPRGTLIVSQTEEVHEQITRLLQKLRRLRDSQIKSQKHAKQDDAATMVLQAYRVAVEVNSIAAATTLGGRVPRTVGADFICGTCLAAGYRGGDMTERQMALNNLAFLPNQAAAGRAMQDLVSLIQDSIEPKSWSGDEDAAIYTIDGRLVVRHTVQVQQRIAALLSQTGLLLPPVRKPPRRGKGGGGDSGGGGGIGGGMF
ncbi:MAG: hypothetical protein IID44_06420 [Planctomycetes bacterium]|nr:hypothetical protein [Planctomycetota bacterium]